MLVLKAGEEALKKALQVLRSGGVIIYPTETLYGLGADALNGKAVKKVFEIKRRPFNIPISVAFSSLKMAKKYVFWSEKAKMLERFLPGPITLVLKAKIKFPEGIMHKGKVGVRIPDHRFTRRLIGLFGGPITSTSANLHKGPEPQSIERAIEQVRAELAIDSGPSRYGKGSTVIDVEEWRVVRRGALWDELSPLFD